MQDKIDDLDFPSFSTEDRETVTEALIPGNGSEPFDDSLMEGI
jgi:hypothetical protein